MGAMKPAKNRTVLFIVVEPELHQRVKKAARESGVATSSSWIRTELLKALRRHEKAQAKLACASGT